MEQTPKEQMPADVILIEWAYCAGPEVSDLVDFTVLVDVPVEERHARLEVREDYGFLKTWHQRWDEVEAYYFSQVRPKSSFDLIIEAVSGDR